ncbi:MAG: hypothetical protein Q4G16_12875 [Cruoricaptor ignavus]|nr:hypothetical protein [Cruoricaptor ignavus]
MKTIIFLIVLLNILSCSIAKNNIIGEYGYEGENTIDSIIIEKNNVYTHKIFNKEKKIMYIGKSKWKLEKGRITLLDFYTNEDYNLTEFLTDEQASKFLMTVSYPLHKKGKHYVIEANADESIYYTKK